MSQWTAVAFIFFITILPVIAEESCPGPVLKLKNYADLIEEQAKVIAECRRTIEELRSNITCQCGDDNTIKADVLSQNKDNTQGELTCFLSWVELRWNNIQRLLMAGMESTIQIANNRCCFSILVQHLYLIAEITIPNVSFYEQLSTHKQVCRHFTQCFSQCFFSHCCLPGSVDIIWHSAERWNRQVQQGSSEWWRWVSCYQPWRMSVNSTFW